MARSNKAPESDVDFAYYPNWNFNDDKLKFNWNHVSNYNPNYGSASGASSVYRYH